VIVSLSLLNLTIFCQLNDTWQFRIKSEDGTKLFDCQENVWLFLLVTKILHSLSADIAFLSRFSQSLIRSQVCYLIFHVQWQVFLSGLFIKEYLFQTLLWFNYSPAVLIENVKKCVSHINLSIKLETSNRREQYTLLHCLPNHYNGGSFS